MVLYGVEVIEKNEIGNNRMFNVYISVNYRYLFGIF